MANKEENKAEETKEVVKTSKAKASKRVLPQAEVRDMDAMFKVKTVRGKWKLISYADITNEAVARTIKPEHIAALRNNKPVSKLRG